MPIVFPGRPVSIRRRNRDTDAQLEDARTMFGVSWKGILVTILIVLALLVLFYLVKG